MTTMSFIIVVATAAAFSSSSSSMRSLPNLRRQKGASPRILMEDFGLFRDTTEFSFKKSWGQDVVISEARMEAYLNQNGYRYKLNKTPDEREGQKLFDFPQLSFKLGPIDVNIGPPEVNTIWEAFGFDSARNVEMMTTTTDDQQVDDTIKPVSVR